MIQEQFQQEYFNQINNLNDGETKKHLLEEGFHIAKSYMTKIDTKLLYRYSKQSLSWSIENGFFIDHKYCVKQWSPDPHSLSLIFSMLKQYKELNYFLNSDKLRLDRVMFSTTANNPSHLSTGWHRDSVGNRIKIFIIIAVSGSVPRTDVIKSSHKDTPYSKNIDLLRTRADMNLDGNFQKFIGSFLSSYYKTEPEAPEQNESDCIYLDTNNFHRSYLPSMHSKGNKTIKEGTGMRLKLELEFMHKDCSNFSIFLGPCAPGQSPLLIAEDSINQSELQSIDQECYTPVKINSQRMNLYSINDRIEKNLSQSTTIKRI